METTELSKQKPPEIEKLSFIKIRNKRKLINPQILNSEYVKTNQIAI